MRACVARESTCWATFANYCPNWPNGEQALPGWNRPANDPDCDGFTNDLELALGTDPLAACPATAGTDDAWPYDNNIDRTADLSDVLGYNQVGLFASAAPGPPYDARYDLTEDGIVDLSDVLRYNAVGVFGYTCTP